MFINFQAFVIKLGPRRIMIDTCVGADRDREFPVFTRMQTTFLEDLASIGITPQDVDTVLCTHLHFDHVGWNTRLVDGRWVPTFPRARYLFSRKEYEHWLMLRDTRYIMFGPGVSTIPSAVPVIPTAAAIEISTFIRT
jgi:glyoxylase-like metal-dependent hydrolase (beta-lactamase superfamily II)